MEIQKEPIQIGRNGKDVLALTFSGGGFATAMQLGVIHALLANEPTTALMGVLQEHVSPNAGEVRVYSVTTLPVSKPSLAAASTRYPGLRSVVERVLDLQRFRDARLEKRLTEMYSSLLPPGKAKPLADRNENGDSPGKHPLSFVRANLFMIEPDEVPKIFSRLGEAKNSEEYRDLILGEVAKGCRVALETMIQPSIERTSSTLTVTAETKGHQYCRAAIRDRLPGTADLPGSDPKSGPGVAEICLRCALANPDHKLHSYPDRVDSEWPRAAPSGRPAVPPVKDSASSPTLEDTANPVDPKSFPEGWGDDRPTVSLLLSGGVFRGVFQVGVLAGLMEARLRPVIFAGASVGSIMAAMGARLFAPGSDQEKKNRLCSLATTFLNLNRFILTDRFSDFVRRFTLRAKSTEFSIADLDRTFRRYDALGTFEFSQTARRTVSGLERLLHLSPFEQLDLLRYQRAGESVRLATALADAAQSLLDRYGVGEEILGSERLAYLILNHALTQSGASTTFSNFLDETGATLLAVATNLTEGRLDTLGASEVEETLVLETLLASSAFPAVFQPRWSNWLRPSSGQLDRYTDGGVMDNLPLDSVVRYLDRLSNQGKNDRKLLSRRPCPQGYPVPHLLLCASLEPWTDGLSSEASKMLRLDWPLALRRAGTVGYNRKIDEFAAAQRDFRRIWNVLKTAERDRVKTEPLDIEIAAVKPRWLCGTFAFHPMLGFRRSEQARSIAHGCASTLAILEVQSREEEAKLHGWFAGWGADGFVGTVEKSTVTVDKKDRDLPLTKKKITLTPRTGNVPEGNCWFRRDHHPCPFFFRPEETFEGSKEIAQQLNGIYRACGRKDTHQSNEERREVTNET